MTEKIETKEVKLTEEEYIEEEKKSIKQYMVVAKEKDILSLDPYQIESQFPLAYKACVDYMSKRADVPVGREIIVSIFVYSPTMILYKFFDENGIYINILGQDNSWEYCINQIISMIINETRVQAEAEALLEAFSELEKKLKNK